MICGLAGQGAWADNAPASNVIEEPGQAIQLINGIPEQAFIAALTHLIVQDGCVLDFSDYEQQQSALITGMKRQFAIGPDMPASVDAAMDMRLSAAFETMQGRFEIDEDTRTATLVGACEVGE